MHSADGSLSRRAPARPSAPDSPAHEGGLIRIRGARQHNLKNLDLDIRTGEMTVFTGPSGLGKNSLMCDTLYAEGRRRYVETFSAYARQFLDRMDRPAVDRVDGMPPATIYADLLESAAAFPGSPQEGVPPRGVGGSQSSGDPRLVLTFPVVRRVLIASPARWLPSTR